MNFSQKNTMRKTVNTLENILTLLFQIQNSAWHEKDPKLKPSKRALKTYHTISGSVPPITLEETRFVYKPPNYVLDFSQRGRVLYLPPLQNKVASFVPILSPYCKLNQTRSIARLQVMLIRADRNRNSFGMGFRLETPGRTNQNANATDKAGIHDFYHAQLIREFRQKRLDKPLPIDCPSWLPVTQPSFPLPARCPVMLLLCLIVTLYGRKYYNQFLTENPIFDIRQYREILDPWINQEC